MFFKYLNLKYGSLVSKFLRLSSKTSMKIVRLTCQKDFLLNCKRAQVIPFPFKVKTLVNSVKGMKIAKHASLEFISAAISLCYGNIKSSKKILHMRMQSLLGMVEDFDKLGIISYLSTYSLSTRKKFF